MEDLNSFDNFIESDSLSRLDRITRDLTSYILTRAGSAFYARNAGANLSLLENNENSDVYDILVKVRIIEMVATYNQTSAPEYQALTAAEMIIIDREVNKLTLFVGFFPFVEPSVDMLSALRLTLGGL